MAFLEPTLNGKSFYGDIKLHFHIIWHFIKIKEIMGHHFKANTNIFSSTK